MASIISGILSLPQYLISLKEQPSKYKLKCCPYPDCGAVGLWGDMAVVTAKQTKKITPYRLILFPSCACTAQPVGIHALFCQNVFRLFDGIYGFSNKWP
jgi:hypothetical protein